MGVGGGGDRGPVGFPAARALRSAPRSLGAAAAAGASFSFVVAAASADKEAMLYLYECFPFLCHWPLQVYGAFDFRMGGLKAKAEHRAWHQASIFLFFYVYVPPRPKAGWSNWGLFSRLPFPLKELELTDY